MAPLDKDRFKVQPKLRMYANCSDAVNACRAEKSSAIAVDTDLASKTPVLRGATPMLAAMTILVPPKVQKLDAKAGQGVKVNVFVETREKAADLPKPLLNAARRGNITASTISLSALQSIASHRSVLHVELGDQVTVPTPQITAATGAPRSKEFKIGDSDLQPDSGQVLIGIIDVEGFDFSHPDFLEGGKTRFLRIWDQGGDARPSPHRRSKMEQQFDLGAEFLQQDLNHAIEASKKLRLPPYEIERQSQLSPGAHATHVASIAAGNHGVCPKAGIVAVLLALANEDSDRRTAFADSTRIALAVDYLLAVASELGKPISINISLGTNGHAHDGTSAISRWIDAAMSIPGRCVCVAAGNAGQEVAESPGDIGFVMGRIHTSGRVPGPHLYKEIEWEVVGDTIWDVSENELEFWYSEQDRFAVSVLPPWTGAEWIGPIEPRYCIENRPLERGCVISIYNELYHPSNGQNYISIYLTPFYKENEVIGVASGTWRVRLHGIDVRDGEYHGWIERDDPRPLGPLSGRRAWSFPSFFSEASNVDSSSVGTLACGRRVISVANLNDQQERVNITSSQGPTRDNRCKPDVAAPGTNVVAANGFAGADDLWIAMTGTSMASPYVAGVAGLMLAVEPRLTAAQIEGIMHRTSRPLPGQPFKWRNDAGYGMVQVSACLDEARKVNQREEIKQ